MKGKIIKGIGGFYYVAGDGKEYCCKAKGVFRNENIKPLIGDEVEISIIDEQNLIGNIDEIHPRRNQLLRPAVSNIDMVLVVLACAKPKPQLYLLDRYLLSIELYDIPAVIVFNKTDLSDDAAEYQKIYENAGYKTLLTSAKSKEGIDELRSLIKGKTIAFAGPSGVGKSSLTNILCPQAFMETGSISRKIERGKHTTRHSELFDMGDSTFLCDTPGFTSVAFEELPSEKLRFYMPDISVYEGKCRFNGCVHLKEPECAVKAALETNELSKSRYDSYVKIYDELYVQERRY